VGSKKDIKLGNAKIMFESKDKKIEEYDIEIKQINNDIGENGKDMIIEVVDETLLDYTGGIVQGMSGAPIIQNNKIIGAITHVFIENSKIGYGIFIDKMIK
jgi:stage IV sporulation protein B